MDMITADDPASKSADLVADNLDRLRDIIPEAFTEGGLNFEVLRELLGEMVAEGQAHYGLNWHRKAQARRLALTQSTGTLRPAKEESVDWETTQNMMIEGDNLEVLKLLRKSYAGKVKLIYIDPPYNTGKEFIYSDRYQDNIDTYLRYTGQVDSEGLKTTANAETQGRYHTNWLNMMYPRLKLARNLLRDDGFIFVSIDDHEVHNLRHLMDEIYGSENFLALVTWQRKKESGNDGKGFAVKGEYVAVYGRSEAARPSRLPLSDEYLSGSYYEPDEHFPDGMWRPVPIAASKGHQGGGYEYTVTTPSGTEIHRQWLYPREGFERLQSNGRIYWGKSGDGIPQRVMYAHESTGVLPDNLWVDLATNKEGKKELLSLFGRGVFDTTKPTGLVRRMLEIASDKDAVIVDFFAGSGTTGQAVMEKNLSDGGTRRFILVQLPQPIKDPEFNTVAEITTARLRAAANALAEEPTGSLPGLSQSECVDLGFRVFKLDSTNLKPWDPQPEDLQAEIEDAVDHVKADRTEDDLLYEVLLKLGLDLSVPIETREIAGFEVHNIGAGELLACLATGIGRKDAVSLARGIAKWQADSRPDAAEDLTATILFRDSGVADDVTKQNLVATLEQAGLSNVRSI